MAPALHPSSTNPPRRVGRQRLWAWTLFALVVGLVVLAARPAPPSHRGGDKLLTPEPSTPSVTRQELDARLDSLERELEP